MEAKRFVGLREAIHSNARHELGRFLPFTRSLGFDWTSKRVPMRGTPDSPLWTVPKSVENPVSQPYLPVPFFGQYVPGCIDEEARLEMINDNPDWLPIIQSTTEDDDFSPTWKTHSRGLRITDGIVWPEVVSICRRKASNANRTRRIMDNDGAWINVKPQPAITTITILRVMLDAFGRCRWCAAQVWTDGTLEHLQRIADGGTNAFANLSWACLPCNRKGYYR